MIPATSLKFTHNFRNGKVANSGNYFQGVFYGDPLSMARTKNIARYRGMGSWMGSTPYPLPSVPRTETDSPILDSLPLPHPLVPFIGPDSLNPDSPPPAAIVEDNLYEPDKEVEVAENDGAEGDENGGDESEGNGTAGFEGDETIVGNEDEEMNMSNVDDSEEEIAEEETEEEETGMGVIHPITMHLPTTK